MTTVGKGQGPLQARLSLMWKSITKSVNAEAHLQGACDTMSRALDQLSRSPFTRRIEEVTLPRRFQQPTFTIYNGNTDPVEHVSQFN